MSYYDRKSDDAGRVLCDSCGSAAWPSWPLLVNRTDVLRGARERWLTGDAAAFERRYLDPSGDWCWTPLYSHPQAVPCSCCGADADGKGRPEK